MAYYKIQREEMVDLLERFGFERVTFEGTSEMVYTFTPPKEGNTVSIYVYTSIDASRKAARDKGEDAIRCIFVDSESGKPVGKTARIHRIHTWEKNLTNRLRTMVVMAPQISKIKCKKCGCQTAYRSGKFGHFFGCLNYPECDGTRNDNYALLESQAVAFLKKKGKWVTR